MIRRFCKNVNPSHFQKQYELRPIASHFLIFSAKIALVKRIFRQNPIKTGLLVGLKKRGLDIFLIMYYYICEIVDI